MIIITQINCIIFYMYIAIIKKAGTVKRCCQTKQKIMNHIMTCNSCGQVDQNIIMINKLKQLLRTRTNIELWPSGYSITHAICSQLHNKLE